MGYAPWQMVLASANSIFTNISGYLYAYIVMQVVVITYLWLHAIFLDS